MQLVVDTCIFGDGNMVDSLGITEQIATEALMISASQGYISESVTIADSAAIVYS